MAYKLYGRQVFRATVNGKEYTFTCYGQGTAYGFRHICTLGFNDTTECKWIKDDIISKACYYNRTWERFTYETVLASAIRKLPLIKEIRDELHAILIDGKAYKLHEQVEKDLKEFEQLWNGLTDKNKDHITSALGDRLIQNEEQAKAVVNTMKLMNAMQKLEEK